MTSLSRLGKPLLLSLLAFGATFACHFARLSQSPFASGWDAYFYLVQVKAMVEEGSMHSPDISPVYLLLKWIYLICGDYELAFQLLCAGLTGLFTSLVCLLAFQHSRSWWIAGLLGLWFVSSSSLAYFGANFPKNLLGINFMLVLFWASTSRYKWLQVPALVLSAVSHRLTAVLSIVFLGCKRLNVRTLFLLLGIGGLILLLASLVPGLIHWSDLKRFDFVALPHFPAWSFVELLDLWHTQPLWIIEIVLVNVLLVWMGWTLLVRKSIDPTQLPWFRSLFFLTLLLSFPFLEMSSTSMGYRFFLTSLLIIPLFGIAWLMKQGLWVKGSLTIILLLGSIFAQFHIEPQKFDPDYAYYDSLSGKTGKALLDSEAELIIAHNGLAEVVTFQNSIDAMPWVPEYEMEPNALYRIAFGIEAFEIKAVLGRDLKAPFQRLDLFYLLLLEEDWREFTNTVKEIGEDKELLERIYAWENPSRKRPAFLLRNKSDQ